MNDAAPTAATPRRRCPGILLLAASLCLGAPRAQQIDRYELGLRLRAFERHLGATADPNRRRPALRHLETAVEAFFAMNMGAVAKAIAAGEQALRPDEADPAQALADSLQLRLPRRLVAPAGTLTLTISTAFAVGGNWPADLRLELALDGEAAPRQVVPLRVAPATFELQLGDLAAGDRQLRWSIHQGERELLCRRQALSIAKDVDARLASLAAAVAAAKAAPPESPNLLTATLPLLVDLLGDMTLPRPGETELPGARLLVEAEALAAAIAAGEPFHGPERIGQHWLRLVVAGRGRTVRLLVPPGSAPTAPRPLVIALHGAGGSENLFFDGYGDGAIVRQCEQRGWYLVAPRSGFAAMPLPALIDALAAHWPIDTTKVLLVGHSMGAAHAVGAATATPQRFVAVAALGGGGSVPRDADLGALPFFVGVGERDFARPQAQALGKALLRAKAPTTLREFPDLEHLAIVQFALPDVFAFFDANLSARAK
jgi:pimeloyl-ACP methyl ester carboxylesterase